MDFASSEAEIRVKTNRAECGRINALGGRGRRHVRRGLAGRDYFDNRQSQPKHSPLRGGIALQSAFW